MTTKTKHLELGDGLAVRDNKVATEGNSKFPLRYDLISPTVIRALAETYGEGAIKYGDNNWKKGFPEGNLLNHALAHIVAYMEGDTSEPHLEHALWNIGTQIHFDRLKKS